MTASAAEYEGRTVDLLAYGGKKAGSTLLTQQLARADAAGELCTGIQKLAQRWLLEFLTERASMRYLPERGCVFLTAARLGQLRTTADVQRLFYLSAKQIEVNIKSEEDDTMPDDERLGKVTLTGIGLGKDWLTLTIEIGSRAGTARKVILPLAVMPHPVRTG